MENEVLIGFCAINTLYSFIYLYSTFIQFSIYIKLYFHRIGSLTFERMMRKLMETSPQRISEGMLKRETERERGTWREGGLGERERGERGRERR